MTSRSNEIGVSEASRLIAAAFSIKDVSYVFDTIHDTWPDRKLELTTAWELVQIAKSIPKKPYIPDRFDCDDFAREFVCKAKSRNPKMCITSKATFDSTYKIPSPHEMCVDIMRYRGEKKVVVIEPQHVGKHVAHLLRWPRKSKDELRILCF